MSDRIKALTVILRADMRDDDAEHVISAIQMIKGVSEVTGIVTGIDHYVAVSQAKRELREALWNVLQSEVKP